MNKNERKILIKKADGKEVEGNILFTFNENGDNYVLYELDNKAYGAKIDENNKLSPIEKDEWQLVEKIFNEYLKDYNPSDFEDN